MDRRLALLGLAAALALPLAACDGQSTPARPISLKVLRFSGIPDADKDKLTSQYRAVQAWLERELGLPVEYVHAPDYTGVVTALASNKIDLAWLGGVTAVQAEEVTEGKALFLAARDTDLRFKTYFIARRELVESGQLPAATSLEPMPLSALAALKPALAGCRFTFGSKRSTSGHIMPRHFLELPEVGISPERDFAAPAGYQLQGGHSATLQAVASGAVDVGALNYKSWEVAEEALRSNAPVVYVTPEYVDYCMVAHERIGLELAERIREAFVGLDPAVPEQRRVLEAFSAQRFVAADPTAWDGIRAVLRSARERGILD